MWGWFSAFTRGAILTVDELTHSWSQYREKKTDCGVASSEWGSYITLPPHKSQGISWKRKRKNCKKVKVVNNWSKTAFLYVTAPSHTGTVAVTACGKVAGDQTCQNPIIDRRGHVEFHIFTSSREPIVKGWSLGDCDSVLFRDVDPERIPTFLYMFLYPWSYR